jgi:hypothetical protein
MSNPALPSVVPKKRTVRQKIRRIFEILGYIATALAIYHYGIKPFAESRSISAAYRFRTVAEETSTFDIKSYVRPDFAEFKKLAALDVLVWNSGTETIDANDVSRPITMKISESSKIVEARVGPADSRLPAPSIVTKLIRPHMN